MIYIKSRTSRLSDRSASLPINTHRIQTNQVARRANQAARRANSSLETEQPPNDLIHGEIQGNRRSSAPVSPRFQAITILLGIIFAQGLTFGAAVIQSNASVESVVIDCPKVLEDSIKLSEKYPEIDFKINNINEKQCNINYVLSQIKNK